MIKDLSESQTEIIKRTCITAAQTLASEQGFAASKTLWHAILKAFFAPAPAIYSLPNGSQYGSNPQQGYRKEIATCLSKLSDDIAFLELYQNYLEEDLSATGMNFKESSLWLEIAESLISLRKSVNVVYQRRLWDEGLALAKYYLEAGEYEKAIEHLSTLLLGELGWEFSGVVGPILFRAAELISLLLTAHEQNRIKLSRVSGTYSHSGGLKAAEILLVTTFTQQHERRSYRGSYGELLLQVTYELTRLFGLKDDLDKSIQCLKLTCNAFPQSNLEYWLRGSGPFCPDGIRDPDRLPRLWCLLAAMQKEKHNEPGAIEAAEAAAEITNKYLDVLSTRFAQNKLSERLNSYINEGNTDGLSYCEKEDFPLFQRLQQLKIRIENLRTSIGTSS